MRPAGPGDEMPEAPQAGADFAGNRQSRTMSFVELRQFSYGNHRTMRGRTDLDP